MCDCDMCIYYILSVTDCSNITDLGSFEHWEGGELKQSVNGLQFCLYNMASQVKRQNTDSSAKYLTNFYSHSRDESENC